MKAKQIARWTLTAVFVLGSRLAGAQPGGDFGGDFGGGMPPFAGEDFRQQQVVRPDNREAAKRMTDEMQRSLTLTDKQYKKVYKLNLKWLDNLSSQSGTEDERPSLPMGDGFDGGERPGSFPESSDNTPESGRQSAIREATDEELAGRSVKLKKILTAEQYDQWRKSEADRRNPVHRRQPGNRCGNR